MSQQEFRLETKGMDGWHGGVDAWNSQIKNASNPYRYVNVNREWIDVTAATMLGIVP